MHFTKLVYGSATANKDEVKEVEGLKAFFVNDISDAGNEINDLQQLDVNMDGVIRRRKNFQGSDIPIPILVQDRA